MCPYNASDLQITIADGAAADTNMAIAGIKMTDRIIHVSHFSTKAAIATMADVTSTCSITSDGNIQCTSDLSSDQIKVYWDKRN